MKMNELIRNYIPKKCRKKLKRACNDNKNVLYNVNDRPGCVFFSELRHLKKIVLRIVHFKEKKNPFKSTQTDRDLISDKENGTIYCSHQMFM